MILKTIQKMQEEGVIVTQKKLAEKMDKKTSYISKEVKRLKKWIEVSKGDKTTNILSVEVLPDSIQLPTVKEVKKAKVTDPSATRGEVI